MMTMSAIPHGERPLWIIVIVALVILVPILASALRPSRHERSIYYRTKGRRE